MRFLEVISDATPDEHRGQMHVRQRNTSGKAHLLGKAGKKERQHTKSKRYP